MKNLLYIIPLMFLIFACEVNEERLDVLENEENRVNTFYRFDNNQPDVLSVSEGASTVVRIESPMKISGENQDVELIISLSGVSEAEMQSLTFTNASEVGDGPEGNINELSVSGNTITAVVQNNDTLVSTNLDIRISAPTDGITDGDKELIMTLESATLIGNSNIGINVGEPDSSLKEKTIRIIDIDCPSELSGTYGGDNCYGDPTNPSVWVEDAEENGLYELSDFTGGYYGYAGATNIPLSGLSDGCGNLSAPDFDFSILSFTNISGTVNEDGTITLNWTESTGFATGGAPTNCFTTFTPAN